jgi:hypothetical protein
MLRFGAPQPVLLNRQLRYSPTGEWIFPSVLDASVLSSPPLARWYLYYSPHDAPGGVCLALADSLTGPWAEYQGNPVISNEWSPYYRVSHVASPHALWIEPAGKVYLWFHGENHETRYASSDDGIRFNYEGIAISTAHFDNSTECSYGRVFRHTMPSKGNAYVIMIEGNIASRRVIHLGWSDDARAWRTLREPYLVVPERLGGNGGSPWLLRTEEGLRVVYNAGRFAGDPKQLNILGNFCEVRVNEDLEPSGPHRLLHRAREGYPDFGRVADFSFITDEQGQSCAFYTAGKRLEGRLFLMVATERAEEAVSNKGDAGDD